MRSVRIGAAAAILAPGASAAPTAPATSPHGPAYHYVALDALPLPDGFTFIGTPVAVTNDRRIYGEIVQCGEETCDSSIYMLRDRQVHDRARRPAGRDDQRGARRVAVQ